jgi:carbamoyltransferase
VLGIWDGHDAGAALVAGEELLFAVNEERLTRRKLEVGFPRLAIAACLEGAGVAPGEVAAVAASTTDPAKTLTRLIPGLKEEYYLIRRRKLAPRRADALKKAFKYRFTELAPNALSRALSLSHLRRQLRAAGLPAVRLEPVDHHRAHAAAAALGSDFDETLVVTLDGVGDGLSGSFWRWRAGELTPLATLPAATSLGIFFEHVTNLMNMRELEDEGKVMALANYAYPIPDAENPLMAVIGVEGLEIVSPYSSTAMFKALKAILWRYPSEQFAYMAQRTLEHCAVALVAEALRRTGLTRMAAAGGVFSNIKMTMRLAELPALERLYVFPHMGDGGLAIGAALEVNRRRFGATRCRLPDLYLGPGFSSDAIAKKWGKTPISAAAGEALPATGGQSPHFHTPFESADRGGQQIGGLRMRRLADPAGAAAGLILAGEILLWFQGRMEIGPRALGHRSILARPDDRTVKDRLNLLLKKRVWYQPFCPSLLAEDAEALLETGGRPIGDNPFMTMGFRVRSERLDLMAGVINVDGTCRPHFVRDEAPRYRALLLKLKEALGYGVVLNTSLNLHGEPMVCAPGEALEMLRRTGFRYLIMEDWLLENPAAANR